MKKIICLVLSIIAIIGAVLPGTAVAFAQEPVLTKSINYTHFTTHNDIVGADGYQCSFNLGSDSAVYAEFDLSVSVKKVGNSYAKKLDGTNGVKFYIISLDGDAPKIAQTANIMLGKNNLAKTRQFCSNKVLPAGKYALFAAPCKDDYIAQNLKCKFTVFTYAGYAEQAKFPASVTVNTGATKRLNLTELTPTNTIAAAKWATSDKSIAKIAVTDKNFVEITGVKSGSCTVTATLKNGKQYACKVTVKNPAPKISEKTLELPKTGTQTLKILYTKKAVTWQSSNEKIATVSKKGKVTAKSNGSCKITAKCGGKKYTCKLKVVRAKPDFAATLVEYNKKENYFVVKFKNYGEKTLRINAKGAACMADKDSQTRHINPKNKKDIVIKPGKAKTVKLYVKGKKVTAKLSKIGIMYYFRYAGEQYTAGVWCEDSTYKRGKKWKPTYAYECDMYRIRGLEYDI